MFARIVLALALLLPLASSAAGGDAEWHDVGAWVGRDREDRLRRGLNQPDPALARLGEKLFFDPVLSGSGRTSCATCHDPNFAFAQPLRVSIFDNGRIGPRNAPSILAAPHLPALMWDGRFHSLEEQVFGPLGGPNSEMGLSAVAAAQRLTSDPAYRDDFRRVFERPPFAEGIAAAIAGFERSLVSGWSPFDRFYLNGDRFALSDFERLGFEIFTGKARCVACHALPRGHVQGYALFTDFRFHNIGIGFHHGRFTDRGLASVNGDRGDTGAFRTPSLRNVAVTAPYMHDGSLSTLRDVVEFYNAGGRPNPYQASIIKPLGLTETEKRALVAFLNTLTTDDYARPQRGHEPDGAALDDLRETFEGNDIRGRIRD